MLRNLFFLYLLSSCIYPVYVNAQETAMIKIGINLMGLPLHTIDLEGQYMISEDINLVISGGHQFKKEIPKYQNTDGGFASGSFVRVGVQLITSKPERKARFFFKVEGIYSTLKHETQVVVTDYYETFHVPYHFSADGFGGSFGYGFLIDLFKKWDLDFNVMSGFTSINEPFIIGGYPLPGYYFGRILLFHIRPCITFKHKF